MSPPPKKKFNNLDSLTILLKTLKKLDFARMQNKTQVLKIAARTNFYERNSENLKQIFPIKWKNK